MLFKILYLRRFTAYMLSKLIKIKVSLTKQNKLFGRKTEIAEWNHFIGISKKFQFGWIGSKFRFLMKNINKFTYRYLYVIYVLHALYLSLGSCKVILSSKRFIFLAVCRIGKWCVFHSMFPTIFAFILLASSICMPLFVCHDEMLLRME